METYKQCLCGAMFETVAELGWHERRHILQCDCGETAATFLGYMRHHDACHGWEESIAATWKRCVKEHTP